MVYAVPDSKHMPESGADFDPMRLKIPLAGMPARRGRARPVLGACLALVLAGCASLEGVDEAARTEAPEAVPEAAAPMEREPEFQADIFYKVLVAEFAGRRGQLPLAVSSYLEAARQTRDPDIAERATRVAVFARDQENGLEAARLWTEISPEQVTAKQVYMALLVRAGEQDLAAAQARAIVDHWGPHDAQGFNTVSDTLGREKDRAAAVRVMERTVAGHGENAHALFAFAHLLVRAGQTDRAVALTRRVLELDPGNSRAVVFYARVLRSQGDTEGAIKILADASASKPDDTELRLTYARLLVDAKRYEEARVEFQRVADADPDNADVRYALGLLLLQTNYHDAAEAQFKRLINLGSRTLAAYFYLGQIAENRKQPEEALAAYARVDRGEHYLNAQIRVAVLLADGGDLEGAREHLQGLTRRDSKESIRVYRAEAEVLSRHEQVSEAIGVYDGALEEFPGNTDLLYARAMLAAKLDRVDDLERDLREVLAREPNNADALNALGYTLADRTERYDEALDLIKRAMAIKPNDYYILDSMGWVLYRLGRYQESLTYLRRALELNDDPEIAAHLGEVLWVMGERDSARQVWETALKSTPDDKRLLDVIKRFSN